MGKELGGTFKQVEDRLKRFAPRWVINVTLLRNESDSDYCVLYRTENGINGSFPLSKDTFNAMSVPFGAGYTVISWWKENSPYEV